MKKYLLIFVNLTLASGILLSQNEVDALRYTYTDFNGTARYTSMGGAFGALGGDLSSVYNNPAGIAVYRAGELSFSPGFLFNTSNSTYNGTSTNDSKVNFNLGNLGFAVAIEGRQGSKIKLGHFGINYNRIQDFHNNYTIRGENTSSSLSDVFANQAFGVNSQNLAEELPFTSLLAYETFLINPGAGANEYISEFPGGLIEQFQEIETSGRLTQTDIAFGLNYDNKLYLGASIGLAGFKYTEEKIYREFIREEYADNQLEEWSYLENLESSGSGINLNIGLIYKVADLVRIGAAWHSPTYYYQIEDNWNTSLFTQFADGFSSDAQSVQGLSRFNLTTPSRYQASIAFIFAKKGLFSIDYEFLNYGKSELDPSSDSPADFTFANNEIAQQFTNAGKIRLGAEYRLLPLSIRAGAGYNQSPYVPSVVVNAADKLFITAGLGIKMGGNKYLDFAINHSRFSSDFFLYDPNLVNLTKFEHSNNTIRFTYGIKF